VKRSRRSRARSALFGAASVLTAGTLVAGLGVGLVAHVFAGTRTPQGDCATRVAQTNALVARTVFAVVPANTVRAVDAAEPAELDAADCTWSEAPGGFEALWNGTTGAATVRLLQNSGWSRTDPEGGAPGWFLRDERSDGRIEVGMSASDDIVLTKESGDRRFGISVDRAGMSAWVE
jgi:hypothetical protein